MKNTTMVFALVLVCTAALQAQDNYFYLNLDINTPTTNTEWMGGTSARGGKIGYRAFIGESRFSAGVDFSWAYFDAYEPTQTFYSETGAITTDYFKNLNQYSIAASGQYNFPLGESEMFFPYAGLGLGAMHNEYVISYNIYSEGEKGWGFLARPEAGMLVKFGRRRSIGAMAAVHYDYATTKSESYNYSSYSAIGFQIGILVMSR